MSNEIIELQIKRIKLFRDELRNDILRTPTGEIRNKLSELHKIIWSLLIELEKDIKEKIDE